MTAPPVAAPAKVMQIASLLLGCLCAELDLTPAGAPCFCGMTVGNSLMPTDSCLCNKGGTKCGTAWVRLDSVFPSASFPNPDTTPRGSCTSPLAYRFHVGVVRCTPGLTATGQPPSAATMLGVAERGMDDMLAAYKAIQCCAETGRGEMLVGAWTPIGAPDGDCAGGFWPVTYWGVR